MKIAVVLVHYHTPQLLRRAVDALQSDARRSGLELEGVVVDNGSRPADRALLAALPFRVLSAPDNLGYAGGANLGLTSTEADLAIVMNPDVVVLPGCLGALINALHGGAAVAGPRFYWDAERRFQLPPTEAVHRGEELLRLLAEGGGLWCRWARRRWRRHSRRFFLAEEPLPSFDLSGALLALRRDAWRRVGPMDTEYALYFEETDWLQRMRRDGQSCCFVPAAEAVHLYAQSTAKEGRAQQWFQDSQRRFRRRVYGRRWTAALEGLGARLGVMADDDVTAEGWPKEAPSAGWLEVSASPKGFPAAVRRLSVGESFEIPEAIRQRMSPGTYYVRRIDDSGRDDHVRRLVVDPS